MKGFLKSAVLIVIIIEAVTAADSLESCDAPNDKKDPCTNWFPEGSANCMTEPSEIVALCPVTCKKCAAYENCKDDSDILDCNTVKDECKSTDIEVLALMEKHCPKTCGMCKGDNSELCKDLNPSLCVAFQKQCNSQELYDFMTVHCASTCNRCKQEDLATVCADQSTTCSTWKANGFCTNNDYSEEVKRSHCAKTCGYCK